MLFPIVSYANLYTLKFVFLNWHKNLIRPILELRRFMAEPSQKRRRGCVMAFIMVLLLDGSLEHVPHV